MGEQLEVAPINGELVRRLVRADDGTPVGAFVMYVPAHDVAQVVQVIAAPATWISCSTIA